MEGITELLLVILQCGIAVAMLYMFFIKSSGDYAYGDITVIFRRKNTYDISRINYLRQLPRYNFWQHCDINIKHTNILTSKTLNRDVVVEKLTIEKCRDGPLFVFDQYIYVRYSISGKNVSTLNIDHIVVDIECIPHNHFVTDYRMDTAEIVLK